MPVDCIHSFLVYPARAEADLEKIIGTEVSEGGQLYEVLERLFEHSEDECKIDIAFNKANDVTQNNEARSLLVNYAKHSSIEAGRKLAEKLAWVSTGRSGLGLLFLIQGRIGDLNKTVVARFPADSGILATKQPAGLVLEFIEQIFMKSSKAFKSVMYTYNLPDAGFRTGRAVDKQVNTKETEISAYWITKFLESDFRTTSAEGTRRLAAAMRKASKEVDDLSVKREITAATTLARAAGGQTMSINGFFDHFGFAEKTREAIRERLGNARVMAEQFQFDVSTFSAQVPLQALELDTGVILTAPAEDFERLVTEEALEGTDGKSRFSTEGRTIDQTLRKVR